MLVYDVFANFANGVNDGIKINIGAFMVYLV